MTVVLWCLISACVGGLLMERFAARDYEARLGDAFRVGLACGRAERTSPVLEAHIRSALAAVTEWEPTDREIRGFIDGGAA